MFKLTTRLAARGAAFADLINQFMEILWIFYMLTKHISAGTLTVTVLGFTLSIWAIFVVYFLLKLAHIWVALELINATKKGLHGRIAMEKSSPWWALNAMLLMAILIECLFIRFYWFLLIELLSRGFFIIIVSVFAIKVRSDITLGGNERSVIYQFNEP